MSHFNSHAHVERDDFEGIYTKFKTLDFNSHAHVERDATLQLLKILFVISTHTLTWSVTLVTLGLALQTIHFNSHAHVERDCIIEIACIVLVDFNSHAHVERD